MDQVGKIEKVKSSVSGKTIVFNVLSLLVIFAFLLLLRIPLLINADFLMTFDEAYQASQMLDLMKGGAIHFYYEGERYAGIFLGIVAIPLFWLFGVSSLAYKVPAVIAYAFYILSSYWLAKKINPATALIVVFLMIFSPPIILEISTYNWPHNLIVLLGNVIILLFIKCKESESPKVSTAFALGAFMGFAIYSYTYSILYIASIALVYMLTHDKWDVIRNTISIRKIFEWWKSQESKKLKFIRFLDGVIICFVGAILFSYVFGGFGIDIAGYSILQINKLHKPVGQVLIIMIFRGLIYRDDIKLKRGFQLVQSVADGVISIRLLVFGVLGFLLGILPRLGSLMIGETTRGGQGFDVDFNPVKIIDHLWGLVTFFIPNFFGVREPFVSLLTTEISPVNLLWIILAVAISVLIVKSTVVFYSERLNELKDIIQFKSQKFNPGLVLVIFPILICSAVVIIQNGTVTRYLLPLHCVVSIWVAMYLNKIRLKSKLIFSGILLAWCSFSLLGANVLFSNIGAGQNFSNIKVVGGYAIPEYQNPHIKLVEYCKTNNISYVYSDLRTAAQLNFFGYGNVLAGVYDRYKSIRKRNQEMSSIDVFSIILINDNKKHFQRYEKFLEKSSLKYSQELVDDKFLVLSGFSGDSADINSLRNLIPVNY